MPSTAGSKILENYMPPYDATCVKKLRENGAIITRRPNVIRSSVAIAPAAVAVSKASAKIELVKVRQIIDSRGNLTVEVPMALTVSCTDRLFRVEPSLGSMRLWSSEMVTKVSTVVKGSSILSRISTMFWPPNSLVLMSGFFERTYASNLIGGSAVFVFAMALSRRKGANKAAAVATC